MRGIERHNDVHICVKLHQTARQRGDLIGGNAASHAQYNGLSL